MRMGVLRSPTVNESTMSPISSESAVPREEWAGPLGSTRITLAPAALPLRSTQVSNTTPSQPACAFFRSSTICPRKFSTWWMGIANAAPELDGLEPSVICCMAIMPLMPTRSPSRSHSGPPELPGLTAASCWIALP